MNDLHCLDLETGTWSGQLACLLSLIYQFQI